MTMAPAAGHPGGEIQGGRRPAREQGDVDAGEVSPHDVLDDDVLPVEAERAPGGAGAGEKAHPVEGEGALDEHRPHDCAHLTGGAEDSYFHGRELS